MARLARPKSVLDAFALLLGGFMGTSGPYGLWDLARHGYTDSPRTPYYPLPFVVQVPWYVAGDLFVTMTFAGVLVFVLAFLDLDS